MSLLSATRNLMKPDEVWPFLAQRRGPVDVSHQVILYVEGLSVTFDGFKALNNLNLYVNDGELLPDWRQWCRQNHIDGCDHR